MDFKITMNNGIIEGEKFGFLALECNDGKTTEKRVFTNNINKKGIMICNFYGYKIKVDVLKNTIISVEDVSTIRNGTAKILQHLNN